MLWPHSAGQADLLMVMIFIIFIKVACWRPLLPELLQSAMHTGR